MEYILSHRASILFLKIHQIKKIIFLLGLADGEPYDTFLAETYAQQDPLLIPNI